MTDVGTNDARTAVTQGAGTYTFVNLNFGPHKLTVSLDGFTTQTYDVLVQSARTTDVKATLKVGAMSEVVEVSGAAPLVETSTNAINTTIDMKQIEDLPLAGRNIAQLSRLTAGYNGTWNGLPTFAQSNSIDGIVGNTNRWRYQTSDSAASIAVTPRIENIAEMVVSSDQMDMNQGFGSSSMSVSYVTRRGTNRFSGRLYEGFRAQYFDATNWGSTVKPKYHRNDFGASLGGPIMKDKMFFFASMAALDVPGGTSRTQNFLSDAAKQGVFTYANGTQANLFSIFAAHNAANGTSFPASVAQINPMTAARLAAVDGYRQNDGGLAQASAQPTDRNLRTWEWQRENSNRTYYPTIRVDSNLSERWRLNVAINQTKQDSPHSNPDFWPGDGRAAQGRSNNATASLGIQTIMSPTLINEFRGGWLYTAQWFAHDGPTDYRTVPRINYNYGNYNDTYYVGNSRYQPNFSVSNTTTWTKGSHTVKFGGNWYREVNKYLGFRGRVQHHRSRSCDQRSGGRYPDERGHSGSGRSGGSLADRCRMEPGPVALRHVGRADFRHLGPSPLRPFYRRLCGRKHAGPGRGRGQCAVRTADVLGAVRPGLLEDETEPDPQHGPALGLRAAQQGPAREVSLDEAPGCLRSDR